MSPDISMRCWSQLPFKYRETRNKILYLIIFSICEMQIHAKFDWTCSCYLPEESFLQVPFCSLRLSQIDSQSKRAEFLPNAEAEPQKRKTWKSDPAEHNGLYTLRLQVISPSTIGQTVNDKPANSRALNPRCFSFHSRSLRGVLKKETPTFVLNN